VRRLDISISDEYIIYLIRFTLYTVLSIASASCILYMLSWLCTVLVLFIHNFVDVCHTLYVAVGCSPYLEIAAFVFMMLLNVKFAHVLYLSIKESSRER
jgi:hypothetical protein